MADIEAPPEAENETHRSCSCCPATGYRAIWETCSRSAFFRTATVLTFALVAKTIILAITIDTPYFGLLGALCADIVAYALLAWKGLHRKEKFRFSLWYLWAVFGTVIGDTVTVLVSVRHLRDSDQNKIFNWISLAHVLHTGAVLYMNHWCYSFFSKRHRIKLLWNESLEIFDIAQAFFQYVSYVGDSSIIRTLYIICATLNYVLFWLVSKAASLPLAIDIDSNHYLTTQQEVRVAIYLEALTVFCDVLTDTPLLIIQLVSANYSVSTLKLILCIFSSIMLLRAWTRAFITIALWRGWVTKSSKVVMKLHGSVVTRRKLIKSKIMHCKHNYMDMSSDNLGNMGDVKLTTAAGRALAHNPPKLTSLNLSRNDLTDASIRPIAEALKENTRLTSINLSDNKIMELGVEYLVNALSKNTSITSLELARNIISNRGAELLEYALAHHPSLLEVSLVGNGNIDQQLLQSIDRLVHRNRTEGKDPALIHKAPAECPTPTVPAPPTPGSDTSAATTTPGTPVQQGGTIPSPADSARPTSPPATDVALPPAPAANDPEVAATTPVAQPDPATPTPSTPPCSSTVVNILQPSPVQLGAVALVMGPAPPPIEEDAHLPQQQEDQQEDQVQEDPQEDQVQAAAGPVPASPDEALEDPPSSFHTQHPSDVQVVASPTAHEDRAPATPVKEESELKERTPPLAGSTPSGSPSLVRKVPTLLKAGTEFSATAFVARESDSEDELTPKQRKHVPSESLRSSLRDSVNASLRTSQNTSHDTQSQSTDMPKATTKRYRPARPISSSDEDEPEERSSIDPDPAAMWHVSSSQKLPPLHHKSKSLPRR